MRRFFGRGAQVTDSSASFRGGAFGGAALTAAAVPMPVASLIRDRLTAGMARGMQDDDWSSFARLVAESAGLKPLS